MKNFFNKTRILILFILTSFSYFQVFSSFDGTDIDPGTKSIIEGTSGAGGFDLLDNIFKKIVDNIFSLLALIIIGVFIYIGYLFITSSGDEAQFKKAWKSFVYTIIGLVIIILSWGIVKLVTTVGI